jgi:hypothetical protein
LIPDQGELAVIITIDPNNPGEFIIESTSALASDNLAYIQHAYLSACTNLGQDANTVHFVHSVVQPAFPTSCDSTRSGKVVKSSRVA